MEMRPKLKETVKIRDRKKRIDLFNEEGIIVSLNKTATFIFRQFDGKKTIKSIIENTVDKYDGVSKEKVKKDVIDIVSRLGKLGFIEFNE